MAVERGKYAKQRLAEHRRNSDRRSRRRHRHFLGPLADTSAPASQASELVTERHNSARQFACACGAVRCCDMAITRRLVMGGFAATGVTMVTRSVAAEQMPPELPHTTPRKSAEDAALRARIMAALAFEQVTVPGAQALAEWETLKRSGRGWPVIIGGDNDLRRIADQFAQADPSVFGVEIPGAEMRSPKDILTAAAHLTFPTDLSEWPGAYSAEELRAPMGEWPSEVEALPPGPSVATDIVTGRFHDRVHILLIPTKFGWEVPAYLRWGNWNACPPPEYHIAALRSWYNEFGTDLVGLSGDTINLRAANRPKTRSVATELARRQYAYCPDIVDQGVGSISALAASLMAAEWWYLWWD